MNSAFNRRLLACWVILAIVVAQFAVTAHACRLGSGTPAAAHYASPAHADAAMPCHGAGSGAPATPDLCAAHCSDGVTAAAALDVPPVALIALPVAVAAFATAPDGATAARHWLVPVAGAPPPALQYCRLLI